MLACSMCALACVFIGIKYAESAWKDAECVRVHAVNPGALLSSAPFLFAQRLFHPGEWPLHSSSVFFLGGFVSCDQIRLLLRVNFLSRHSWLLHPLVPDLICLNLAIIPGYFVYFCYWNGSAISSVPMRGSIYKGLSHRKSNSLKGLSLGSQVILGETL